MSYVLDWTSKATSSVTPNLGWGIHDAPYQPMGIPRPVPFGTMMAKVPKPKIWRQGGAWWCQAKGGWMAGVGATPKIAFIDLKHRGTPRNG